MWVFKENKSRFGAELYLMMVTGPPWDAGDDLVSLSDVCLSYRSPRPRPDGIAGVEVRLSNGEWSDNVGTNTSPASGTEAWDGMGSKPDVGDKSTHSFYCTKEHSVYNKCRMESTVRDKS